MRVNAVNRLLRGEQGAVHVRIDPSCHDLIADLEQVLRDGQKIKKTGRRSDPYFRRTTPATRSRTAWRLTRPCSAPRGRTARRSAACRCLPTASPPRPAASAAQAPARSGCDIALEATSVAFGNSRHRSAQAGIAILVRPGGAVCGLRRAHRRGLEPHGWDLALARLLAVHPAHGTRPATSRDCGCRMTRLTVPTLRGAVVSGRVDSQ
jgi:hypothetical protein